MSNKRVIFRSANIESSLEVTERQAEQILDYVQKAWSGTVVPTQILTDRNTTTLINLARVDTVHVCDAGPSR